MHLKKLLVLHLLSVLDMGREGSTAHAPKMGLIMTNKQITSKNRKFPRKWLASKGLTFIYKLKHTRESLAASSIDIPSRWEPI